MLNFTLQLNSELSKVYYTVAKLLLPNPPPESEQLLAGHPGEGTEPSPTGGGQGGGKLSSITETSIISSNRNLPQDLGLLYHGIKSSR